MQYIIISIITQRSSSVKVNVTILEGIQNLLDCAYSDDGKNNLLGRKLAPSKMNDHHQSRIPLLHSTDWPDITYVGYAIHI